jgi:hypothetical protein
MWRSMSECITEKVVEEFVKHEIARQVNFCQTYFDLTKKWQPYMKLSFSAKNKASQAGRNVLQKPFMVLELGDYLDAVTGFIEYQDYADNAFIGAFKSEDWRVCVRALISHELAHCVQFTLPVSESTLRDATQAETAFHGLGVYSNGHGEFFQKIYCVLRKEFVNHLVEPYCMGVMPPRLSR